MEETLAKISQLDFSFLLYIFAKLVILAGVYWWAKRLPQRWKTIINVGIIILVIRIILFQNPLAWYVYNHTLKPEVIGWRQSSVLYDKFTQYKDHDEVKYLAIGSSQTGFIYGYGYTGGRLSNFAVKTVAGLGPVDMYLYRHNILNYEPKKILLYLSDFDMGRPPTLETFKLTPDQGIYFPGSYFELQKHFSGQQFTRTIKEMLVGEIFPEYKYSFIFKGYLDQLFNKNSAFPTPSARMSPEEYQEYQIKQLKEVIDKDHIETNLYYLNKFISFFEERGIKVVIFEGQYHPDAYIEKNLIVKRKVRDEFRKLEKSHTNVNFLSKSDLVWFDATDFRDGYHVNQKAGEKFVERVKHLDILNTE